MCILTPACIGWSGDVLKVPCLHCFSWCVSAIRDLVGQRSVMAFRVKIIVCPWPFLTSRSPETLILKASSHVGLQREPWHHQPLARVSVERSASSCSRICNGEAVRRPWCYQLDVCNSAHLAAVRVALSPVLPASSNLIGALASASTLWVSV